MPSLVHRSLPVLVAIAIASAAIATGAMLAGCGERLGPPHQRPLPVVDAVPALRIPGPHTERAASYAIDARYDATARSLTAREVLTWKNTGASAVTTLPFHLYLNGFKNETTVFWRETGGHHRTSKAGAWGWIDVTSIKIAALCRWR